jgi:dynein light chain LC8-type
MSISELSKEESKVIPKQGQEKVLIIESDMDDDMQIAAIEIATKDSHISNIGNHEIAQRLKDAFETKFYPTWVCIVGKSYGCRINAQKKHYLCFQIDNRTVILYKYH